MTISALSVASSVSFVRAAMQRRHDRRSAITEVISAGSSCMIVMTSDRCGARLRSANSGRPQREAVDGRGVPARCSCRRVRGNDCAGNPGAGANAAGAQPLVAERADHGQSHGHGCRAIHCFVYRRGGCVASAKRPLSPHGHPRRALPCRPRRRRHALAVVTQYPVAAESRPPLAPRDFGQREPVAGAIERYHDAADARPPAMHRWRAPSARSRGADGD